MSLFGPARVGQPAPPFQCSAVVCGNLEMLSLDYYLSQKQWLVLCFIPAAFSIVCPTEIVAFNNTIDEFTELGCAVAFVSTDSKYSLWQLQRTPKKDGGLGPLRVPLLSDQNHKMCKDYGVLLEDEGMALRGMFIINPRGIVEQVNRDHMMLPYPAMLTIVVN